MFNKNFYPTPIELVKKMIEKAKLMNGEKILEPSAGTKTTKTLKILEKERKFSLFVSLSHILANKKKSICTKNLTDLCKME